MKAIMEQFPATNPNPMLSVEKNGTVLYSNRAGEPLLYEWGVRVGEKLHSGIGDLVQRVISLNSPEKIEVKAGKRAYSLSFYPLPEEECVNIYGFDISDKRDLERKLQESEEDLAEVQKMAHIGNWKWNIVTGELFWSEEVYRIFGLDPQEFEATFDTYFRYVYPDDREYLNNAIKKAFKGEPYSVDNRILTANGEERIVHTDAEIIFNEDNIPVYARGIVQDITKRKQAEKELCESEERFAKAFAHSAAVMSLVRMSDGVYLEVNEAWIEMFGYLRTDVIGRTSPQLDIWMDEDARETMYRTLREKGSIREEEYTMRRASGEQCFALVSAEVITMADEQMILASTLDITELKKAEEALKSANETLEEKVKERTVELEKAYNSLKESEKHLSEAQEMAHIGSWERYFATNKFNWSDEMYRIVGLKPQEFEMSYSSFLKYVHPDDRDHIDSAVKEALKGKPIDIDFRIILANGEERIAHAKGEVVFDEKSNPVRIRGTTQDITEHRKAEEKIQILANAVESSTDAIITKSLDGAVTSWNKGAEQIYGYSSEEIIGKDVSILEPASLKGEIKHLGEMIKQGEKIQRYETLRLRKDGTIINVSITLSPVFGSTGKIVAISAIARDITERKRAEEKLRESEEKYRNIVETANEGILVIDDEARVAYANQKMTEMLGYTLEEGISRSIYDFLSEEYKAIVKLNLEKRKQGISGSYELKLTRKDGSSLWTIVNAKPLFDNDGKFVGSMSMLIDITKRKEAEEALAKIETARKQEIHHRIKNNLQVISSLLDLQAEQFKDREYIKDSEVLKAFRVSQDRVISMALIHEELYKGGGFETLNFWPYIEELAENLFQTYRLGNIDISLKLDLEENLFFDMDTAVPLGIIINELVSNSLEHAFIGREKGEVRIKLHREENGEYVKNTNEDCKSTDFTLTVSDNGVGIPENLDIEDLDSLGLQLVTSLVDQLDGKLELKRNNGTEFTIKFSVTENNKTLATA